ncbi:uncharacterized protein LOC130931280 isoform X1 [Corythoichthys intestinalis]|uniref:uncharacterized protein LOC130931280 isoform X1 n=1 Tax=Corythoichthys intestinalis TaxID=161448 RepID=UPI0025A5760D|nr:uncharacterized protein LOC130931280 isoform X1 [Corythoichthys intestinalis]
MGCRLAAQGCSGQLVSAGPRCPHQRPGAACGSPGSPALLPFPTGKARAGAFRQRCRRVPHQPPGGHEVCSSLGGLPPSSCVGGPSSCESAGRLSSRPVEPSGGLLVPPSPPAGGVAPPSRGGARDLGSFRPSRGGPLRLPGVGPLPSLVFPGGALQPSRSGRAGPPLAEGPALRLPAAPSDLADASEGVFGGALIAAGGPLLAGSPMVSPAAQPVCRRALVPPREAGSTVPVGGPVMASRSSPSPPARLAAEGTDSLFDACSSSVRRTLLNARAPSTRLQYAGRWRLFVKWCGDRGDDPVSCSVPTVLDFLQSLLDIGRSPSTLKVYVAAISAHHAKVSGGSVGNHGLVATFLKGALRLHPRRCPRAPVWDLQLVLDSLCRPPFEPMDAAGPQWVARKAAFLLAVASAKRVGELHALSVLAGSRCNRPLRLARYRPPPGEGGGRQELLCPVRALRLYVDSTASFRRSSQLFVCYGARGRGSALSKQRLSHWVVDTISYSYQMACRPLPSGVRCHSTRGVATSWAALKGVPLEDICAAASWSAPGTFFRFYCLDVTSPHPLGAVFGSEGTSL